MNIVDTSAWLEYFAGTKNAHLFRKAIKDQEHLIVPTIVLYEVFKKIVREIDEHTALLMIAHMRKGQVVDLDTDLAIHAAKLSGERHLPMADSLILATAERHHATIWTLDADFKNIEGVKYFSKR